MRRMDNLSSRKARYVLWAALACAIVAGGGAIVWAAVPHTFNTGDTLQAADLNGNFAGLDTRVSALEAVGGVQPNPWVRAGVNQTKAAWDTLIGMYPPDRYEWGIAYNTPTGPSTNINDGPGATVHRVTFSSWNGGIRVMTEMYLEGDGSAADPPTGFFMGGAAWFFGTPGTFDDACTQAGAFKHEYFQLSGTGITFVASNGCGGGTWYVRLR
jgi:hypothetical protein